ncbi:MAG: EscE/YscE/SsaE family type III secretion system needle protein co-chaperone [Pseudomonadota bacterium]
MDTNDEAVGEGGYDFRMTTLEEDLAGENGAAVKEDAAKRLMEIGNRLKQAMDQGLPKEEYEKTEITYRALAAAHEIVINFPVKGQGQ